MAATAVGWLHSTPPVINKTEARRLLEAHWGRTGSLTQLYAERDLNFRVTSPDGAPVLLKISNADACVDSLRFQSRALDEIARNDPEIPIPRELLTVDGHRFATASSEGNDYLLRVISWLEGESTQLDTAPEPPRLSLGKMQAKLCQALADCPSAGAPKALPWDLRNLQSLSGLVGHISDPKLKSRAELLLARHRDELLPVLSTLPSQVIHNDLNPDNVLFHTKHQSRITGVIDFGDMIAAPRICDLAVSCAYLLDHKGPVLEGALPTVSGWQTVLPLRPEEREILPWLIACRLLTGVLIQGWRVVEGNDPHGDSARSADRAARRLTHLMDQDPEAAVQAISATGRVP